MKKILLFELCLLFLATNFQSDNPPGWYQQTLPVNDLVNDIFFIDTLTGWVVTRGHTNNQDTGYIMKTTNGGDNWTIQYIRNINFTTVQFVDNMTGYVGGASGSGTIFVLKTTNGGDNWIEIMGTTAGTQVDDLYFINALTGWICDSPNLIGLGLLKTTNGGLNWVQQLDNSYHPFRVHFINSDTGWITNTDLQGKLYKTTNGGNNWSLQYTYNNGVVDIYFLNGLIGIATSGNMRRTTDGGFTWQNSPTNAGGPSISFGSDSIGWAGSDLNRIAKSTDGGIHWGYQTSPQFNNLSTFAFDSLIAWAGGSSVVHTTDGGGPVMSIQLISNEVPSDFQLYQNYPNPFNPGTIIKFKVKSLKNVKLSVFDITGKELAVLVNEKLSPGVYEYTFEAGNLPSGVYFYSLFADGDRMDTKKMVLLK